MGEILQYNEFFILLQCSHVEVPGKLAPSKRCSGFPLEQKISLEFGSISVTFHEISNGHGSESSWKPSLAVVMTHGAEFDRRLSLRLFLFKFAIRFRKEEEFGGVVMGITVSSLLLLLIMRVIGETCLFSGGLFDASPVVLGRRGSSSMV